MSGEEDERREAGHPGARGASGRRRKSSRPDGSEQEGEIRRESAQPDKQGQDGKGARKGDDKDDSAPHGPGHGSGRGADGAKPAAPQWSWPTPVPASRPARVAVYAALVALGVLTAAAGALVQSGWFPAGLILALAGAVGLFWGGAKLCRTRLGAALPGAGWVVTVFLLTSPRPEGDFVFAAGAGSYVFLVGGVLAAVMCATIALPAPPVPGHKYR